MSVQSRFIAVTLCHKQRVVIVRLLQATSGTLLVLRT
jgi:hypothetical protein